MLFNGVAPIEILIVSVPLIAIKKDIFYLITTFLNGYLDCSLPLN